MGKSPFITDGDVTLAESTAIIGNRILLFIPLHANKKFKEYLINKYSADGKLKAPSSGPEYLNNLYCKSGYRSLKLATEFCHSYTLRGGFLTAADRRTASSHQFPTVHATGSSGDSQNPLWTGAKTAHRARTSEIRCLCTQKFLSNFLPILTYVEHRWKHI